MSAVDTVLRAYPRIYFACHTRHVRVPDTGEELSARQASILDHLDPVDPTMVGELAEHMGVTASTMSLTLKRLERGGFVRRDRDPADRRVTNVRLTERGERVREANSVLDPERVHGMLMQLDATTRARALEGLTLLADAADAYARAGREGMARMIGDVG